MARTLSNAARQRKKALFLGSYAKAGNITIACQAADIHRSTYYEWTEHDSDFSAALKQAGEMAADLIEEACRQRAVEGVVKETPIYHNGNYLGSVVETKYSDVLAMFLLKGLRPQKYRENVAVDHSGRIGHDVQIREIVVERAEVAGDGRA